MTDADDRPAGADEMGAHVVEDPLASAPEVGEPAGAEAAESGAQAAPTLEVTRLVIAESVDRSTREPVGVAHSFDTARTGKIYAFVIVKNPEEPTEVSIEWHRNDAPRGSLTLKVGHSTRGWRTWATTRLSPKLTGAWTARVVDAHGNVLRQAAFTVR